MAKGLTPNGSIFASFEDIVDIAIMTDKTVEDALKQLEEDEMDGVLGIDNPFSEATAIFMESKEEPIKIDDDLSLDDLPLYSMSIVDQSADDYIEAYKDLNNGIAMDMGDIIDMVVDQY